MTGAEHYQHAEHLLDMASGDELGGDQERFHVAKAQVHATLALAYATASGVALTEAAARRTSTSWGDGS